MLDIIILNKRNGIPHKVRVLGKVDGFSRQCCQPLSPLPVKKVKNAANSNFLKNLSAIPWVAAPPPPVLAPGLF